MNSILAVEPVYLWKICKTSIPEAFRISCRLSFGIVSVSPCAEHTRSAAFTDFPMRGTIEQCLTLIQTIAKLVDKPVQIPVYLTHFRDLADGVQNSSVMFSSKLPANLRQ